MADFSAIEARVIAWVADEQWRLDLFKDPKADIYCASASKMFGVPVHKGDELRQRGKVAELALGYGGGVNALTTMDTKKALTEEEKPQILLKWREANKKSSILVEVFRKCCKNVYWNTQAANVRYRRAFLDSIQIRRRSNDNRITVGAKNFFTLPRV